ncbi:sigma-70 family RNA polymerase sigma factor [Streptomyces sediminimaris]|uniref:sigma-70 family RNA polymerase sigma factor n=1 Tax=Streptomyces sediminimaris TaxID=3383721 RepID=UPI00399A6A2B
MQRQPDVRGPRPERARRADRPPEWIDAMMRALADCPPGPRRQALRDTAIRALLPLARRLARRFRGYGEDLDDLVQVASVGLTKAVDGFVPSRGHAFLSYAVPTIVGELRRHLRDHAPPIRLPRSLQEARGPVLQAVEELEQRYGGAPPAVERIVAHTGMAPALITATLRAAAECRLLSLDASSGVRESLPVPGHTGAADRGIDHVVDVVALASAVRWLTPLERRILHLRFYQERTQQQIAESVGLSQVQVSRALARSCRRLRRILTAVPAEARDRRRVLAAGAERQVPDPPRRRPHRPAAVAPGADAGAAARA